MCTTGKPSTSPKETNATRRPASDPLEGALSRTSSDNRTERVDSEPAGYVERCGTAYLYIDLGHPMFTDMPRWARSWPM
jgi:hypothetical protein